MACTSCNDSSGNKNKSTKSSKSDGTSKNVFKSGMNLLIQAKRIWQQTSSIVEEAPVAPILETPITPVVEETTQTEQQNNDTNG